MRETAQPSTAAASSKERSSTDRNKRGSSKSNEPNTGTKPKSTTQGGRSRPEWKGPESAGSFLKAILRNATPITRDEPLAEAGDLTEVIIRHLRPSRSQASRGDESRIRTSLLRYANLREEDILNVSFAFRHTYVLIRQNAYHALSSCLATGALAELGGSRRAEEVPRDASQRELLRYDDRVRNLSADELRRLTAAEAEVRAKRVLGSLDRRRPPRSVAHGIRAFYEQFLSGAPTPHSAQEVCSPVNAAANTMGPQVPSNDIVHATASANASTAVASAAASTTTAAATTATATAGPNTAEATAATPTATADATVSPEPVNAPAPTTHPASVLKSTTAEHRRSARLAGNSPLSQVLPQKGGRYL